MIALFACLSPAALPQGFPWSIFQARTLKEVVSITTKGVKPGDSMFLATNELPSKMQVTYTGQSRPILPARRDFISRWVGIFSRSKEYAPLYEREYLYKEDDEEYWLPTSAPIAKYFDKELKPGDKITLTGWRAKSGSTSLWITKTVVNGEELKTAAGD